MSSLSTFLPFVNGQLSAQSRLAVKYARDEKRRDLHLDSAAHLKNLADAMMEADARIKEFEDERHARTISQPPILTLKPEELEGLPDEVLSELSEGAVPERSDVMLFQVIEDRGGVASLDQIIVGLYRKTGEMPKRGTLTSKLYRLGQKGQIFSVPERKGVYSTLRLTDEEWAKCFRSPAEASA